METAKIVKVYEIANHHYTESQRETAYRVLLSSGRRCWLVGYGGDHVPAAKEDIDNLYGHIRVPKDDDGSEACEQAHDMIGRGVYNYRQ